MELKPGYKQTEVGVIPEDWDFQRLSALSAFPIQNGVFNAPAKKGRGCKLINVGDLYSAIPIDFQRLQLFDASKDELARFGVGHGDVFFTRSSLTPAGIAHCNIYKRVQNDDVVFDCHIIRVRANTNKIDPFFLFRYCTASVARSYLVGHAKTTTMTTIDQAVIANMLILVPPLPEQRAIAAALSDVDALMSQMWKLIAKKRDLKQAAMQQLLTGKQRLPGFHGEWEVKSVGELAGGDENIVDGPFGSNLKNSDYTATGVPVLQGLNITGDRFVWKEVRYISEKKAKDLVRSNAQVGDLLTVKIGSVGFSALIDRLDGHQFAIIPANLLRVRFRGTSGDPHFVYYALTSTSGKRALKDLAANTAQPALSLTGFRKLLVPAPNSVEEQKAIAGVLSDMDAEIAALEWKRDKTRALKQGMMQELLTGRTRLV